MKSAIVQAKAMEDTDFDNVRATHQDVDTNAVCASRLFSQ